MKKILAISAVSVLLLSACSGDRRPEKERYISAIQEVTCLVFQSADLRDPALEKETKEIFKNYGFDVEDEDAMVEIAQKYDNDAEVQAAVEQALDECAGDLFKDLESIEMMEEDSMAEEVMEGEESTEEPTEEQVEETPAQ